MALSWAGTLAPVSDNAERPERYPGDMCWGFGWAGCGGDGGGHDGVGGSTSLPTGSSSSFIFLRCTPFHDSSLKAAARPPVSWATGSSLVGPRAGWSSPGMWHVSSTRIELASSVELDDFGSGGAGVHSSSRQCPTVVGGSWRLRRVAVWWRVGQVVVVGWSGCGGGLVADEGGVDDFVAVFGDVVWGVFPDGSP